MHKRNYWNELLRLVGVALAISASVFGCMGPDSSADTGKWLSVSEARAGIGRSAGSIQVRIKGHFVEIESGRFALTPVGAEGGSIGSLGYLAVLGDNADIESVFIDCANEDVVIAGLLLGGDPPLLRVTRIDELDDIREFRLGTCDK